MHVLFSYCLLNMLLLVAQTETSVTEINRDRTIVPDCQYLLHFAHIFPEEHNDTSSFARDTAHG